MLETSKPRRCGLAALARGSALVPELRAGGAGFVPPSEKNSFTQSTAPDMASPLV